MKKTAWGILALAMASPAFAQSTDAYFEIGPLALTIPLRTADLAYLYDFRRGQNLVGADTPVFRLWNRFSGVIGAVTSLDGQGTPYVGGDLELGETLGNLTSLGPVKIGGWGGYNFRNDEAVGGLKASVKLWE